MLYFKEMETPSKRLSDQELGQLVRLLLDYAKDGIAPDIPGVVGYAFEALQPSIDADGKAYAEKCEKNRQKALNRWYGADATAYRSIPQDATACNGIPMDAGNANTNTNTNTKNNSFVPTPAGVGDEEKPKRAKKQREPFAHDSNPYICAAYLNKAICERLNVESKPEATLQSWAADFDKCNRIDHRPWDELEILLRWSQEDNFWQQNILSGDKFRKQYETLLAKAKAKGVFDDE